MEILFNAVGGFVVEVGKFVSRRIYPKIENIVRFSSKIESLRKEVETLTKFRYDIKGKVEGEEKKDYKPKPDVVKWCEDVQQLENEWESMRESIAVAKTLTYKCCPKFSLRSQVSTQARNIRDQLCRLKEVGKNFGSNLMVENYLMKKVEFIPGPSIEGQSAATKNLQELLRLLEDDKAVIIGVWGAGGVGKTTLVKNLNNELLKPAVRNSELSFAVVIWVTVPRTPINIRNIQGQIASRLNLELANEGSVQNNAGKICRRLEKEKSFLLILDDVWEAINLDDVGVPRPVVSASSKVIITTRSLEVCSQMKTDIETRVYTLDEDESWQLFVKNVGDTANLEHIQPLAKEIARACEGLPLAITVIGSSMRRKTRVELWEDALSSLKRHEPFNKIVKDKVYNVIKWSYDSLESLDIQSCFLYCSLYPANIPVDGVIQCWWAEGFLGEHDTYEEAYNRGVKMVESLKDACLLEADKMDYHLMLYGDSVKMPDVVRDVARWIANSSGNEHNSVVHAGIELTEISHIKIPAYVKRISFMSNKIKTLPGCFSKCPETTSLLLQDNEFLEKIPQEFFLSLPGLRVLNLSRTSIRALPSSINSLCQLRALILQNCPYLKKLPPIGDLHNLQLLDCDDALLPCLPQGLDKLTNLRILNLPLAHSAESIGQGFFLKLCSIETLDMLYKDIRVSNGPVTILGATSVDEISSLHKLTSVFISVDSSSIFNRDHTWMKRLKTFHIEVGQYTFQVRKSGRMLSASNCEIFSNGELSGMLQFASDLNLSMCRGLRELIANKRFNGLKSLDINYCSCDFRQLEEGCGQLDPLPNLEYLRLFSVDHLKSVSDFSQLLGLRFSKLHHLYIQSCCSLTCLFNDGGAFSVPKHLEEIRTRYCDQLVELFGQCSSSDQATLVDSEIPRLGEHLEELEVFNCNKLRKLPLSIQTSNNIKVIQGESEWWSQLEWDDDVFKSKLQHCFQPFDW